MSNQTTEAFVQQDNNPWTQEGDYEEDLPAPGKSRIRTRAMTRKAKVTTNAQQDGMNSRWTWMINPRRILMFRRSVR